MKKTLFILVFLLTFFLTITYCYASEEDILKEPVKEEEEEIKEENLLKGTGNINNTKSSVSDPLQANSIGIYVRRNDGFTSMFYYSVTDIPIDQKYYITFNGYGYSNYRYPTQNYLIRGQEVKDWTNNSSYPFIGIDQFQTALENTASQIRIFYYEEPTPEPTPDPTPEPTPEPTPDPTPEPIPEVTVSWNSVSENLIRIEERLINIEGEINNFKDIYVSQNEVVSNNIIKKRISDYTTSESLSLFGLMLGFIAGLVYLIHKTIFKWG